MGLMFAAGAVRGWQGGAIALLIALCAGGPVGEILYDALFDDTIEDSEVDLGSRRPPGRRPPA
jgi:hypothetical protein